MRIQSWQLSLAALGICALALTATFGYRNQRQSGYEWLFRRLPTDHAIVVGVDVEVLRRAGLLDLLAGPRTAEELDYRRFVDRTGFDYRTDLDYIAASISTNDESKHFLLSGRFDWNAVFSTARKAGGHCQNTFCDLPGFASGRNFSFLPVGVGALGLSVSSGPAAAWTLARDYTGVPMPSVPLYPLFMAMDAGVLTAGEAIPAGLRPFADILSTADYVVVGLIARNGEPLELALDADCMSEARAASVRDRLQTLLGPDNPLSAMLHGGSLRTERQAVRGRWTLDQNALQALVNP